VTRALSAINSYLNNCVSLCCDVAVRRCLVCGLVGSATTLSSPPPLLPTKVVYFVISVNIDDAKQNLKERLRDGCSVLFVSVPALRDSQPRAVLAYTLERHETVAVYFRLRYTFEPL
jgi:hypothetical protein